MPRKTKFLTNVTHEIRTPMNTILGMSEIAIRKNTAKDLEGPLKTIYREGEGVLEMVNSLLDVSKLESGTVELSHEKYDMETLLYEVSNMVYMNMHNQDLDYRIEIEEGFPSAFYGDRMPGQRDFPESFRKCHKIYRKRNHYLVLRRRTRREPL